MENFDEKQKYYLPKYKSRNPNHFEIRKINYSIAGKSTSFDDFCRDTFSYFIDFFSR